MKAGNLLGIALLVLVLASTLGHTPAAPTLAAPDDAELRQAVEPLSAMVSAKDGQELSQFYAAFADVILRDKEGKIADTQILFRAYTEAGALCFQETAIQHRYPQLPAAINKVLEDRLTKKVRPIDSENRKEIADTFSAIAWALGGPH